MTNKTWHTPKHYGMTNTSKDKTERTVAHYYSLFSFKVKMMFIFGFRYRPYISWCLG